MFPTALQAERCSALALEGTSELLGEGLQPAEFVEVRFEASEQGFGDLLGLFPQGPAFRGEVKKDPAFVFGAPAPLHKTFAFKAFEQRGERARVEVKAFAEVAHLKPIFGPEHHHGDVLEVGQIELGEQRSVGASDGVVRAVEGEADLVVEAKQVVGVGHGIKLHTIESRARDDELCVIKLCAI